jgi:hypothetical protein
MPSWASDSKLDAAQASPCQLAQEFRPDRLGLGCADLHAEHLTSAVGVDAHRDDDRDRDNATTATNLQVGWMSRRWAPYRIAAAGLASPLAEPDVRLSLRIRLSRRHGKVRRILHARRYRSTGVQQSTCCSADPSLQTRLVAWRLLGCLEPHSSLGVAFGRFLWSQVQRRPMYQSRATNTRPAPTQ